MSSHEFVDLIQRMKEIRMSHNFSNDISKQHELYDLVNQVLNFSEGKMSGTEYKIKQLVSKLPSEKKAKGTEKLNSMVSSLKKKGLKEKDIISRLDAKAGNIDRLVAFSKKSNKEDLKKAAIIAGSSLLGAGAAAGGAYAANKATGGKLAAWGEDRWDDVKDVYNKSAAFVGDKADDVKDWTLMQLANGKTAVVDATGKIQGFAGDIYDKTMSKFSKNGVVVSEPEQAVAGPTPVSVDTQDASVAAYFSKKSKAKKAAAIAGAIAGTAGAGYGAYAAMPHIKEGIDTYKTGSEFKDTFEGQTPTGVRTQLTATQGNLDNQIKLREAYENKLSDVSSALKDTQGQLASANNKIGDYQNYLSKKWTIKNAENADKEVKLWADLNKTNEDIDKKLASGEINGYEAARLKELARTNTSSESVANGVKNFLTSDRNPNDGVDNSIAGYTGRFIDGAKNTAVKAGEWVGNTWNSLTKKGADATPVTPENAANDGQSDVVEYFYSDKWGNLF